MRFKHFRKRTDIFTGPTDQVSSASRKTPWAQYIYLAILVYLLFLGIQWAYNNLFNYSAPGILVADRSYIASKRLASVVDITVQVDSSVTVGQPLVVIDKPEDPGAAYEQERAMRDEEISRRVWNRNRKEWEWNSRQKYDDLLGQQKKDMETNRIEMQLASQEKDIQLGIYDDCKKEYEKAQQLMKDGVLTKGEVLDAEKNLRDAEYTLRKVEARYAAVRDKNTFLQNMKINLPEIPSEPALTPLDIPNAIDSDTVLYSPREAVISAVLKSKGEVVQPGEPIIELLDNQHSYILAYFNSRLENQIKPGLKVSVTFKNGQVSEGKIRRLRPTSQPLPPAYKKEWGPREQFIIAEVIPLKEKAWVRICDTEATVYLRKIR